LRDERKTIVGKTIVGKTIRALLKGVQPRLGRGFIFGIRRSSSRLKVAGKGVRCKQKNDPQTDQINHDFASRNERQKHGC
jgi:hypothetical protein